MRSTPQQSEFVTGAGNPRAEHSEAIMRNVQIELIRLEVKYCEKCGGLWFRRSGDTRVNCPTCRAQVLPGDPRNYEKARNS